jgi:hypothetical protein
MKAEQPPLVGSIEPRSGLAVTDQLIKIAYPVWDLSDGPIANGSADSNDIDLQEEVAEGGI